MIIYGYIKAYSLYTSIYGFYFIILWCELMTSNNISHHRYMIVNIGIYGPYVHISLLHTVNIWLYTVID